MVILYQIKKVPPIDKKATLRYYQDSRQKAPYIHWVRKLFASSYKFRVIPHLTRYSHKLGRSVWSKTNGFINNLKSGARK
ncbi:MAG: hypothetical protein A2830_01270 [Candidatus Taylorbacteria bacterium RIFCSPHIGHO2_01_FULL_44_110]|nr:MAG: hypothetical protein A2830_01270 [Candidatus Taylorbacteria bacterium RIFCSPHIGHO2_01_FULL_44_110]